MKRRKLGESGIEVSAIALGTWAMGGAIESWGPVDDGESIAAIQQALECGINCIDTAPIYGLGHAEEITGKAIQGRRQDVVLATKCGLLFPAGPYEQPRRCLKSESVMRQCEQSLRRLKTDYIDLYQCHWPDPKTPIRETMEALSALQRDGKVRAIGVSNFSCEEMTAAREYGAVCSLQAPFSLVQPRARDELIPFCIEHRMGILAYSPLAKGLLTGKFTIADRFHGIRARDPDFLGARYRRNLQLVEDLRPIAAKYDKTIAQLALAWTIRVPGITAALVGAKRPSQVMENCAADWPLDDADFQAIDQLVTST